MIQKSDESDSKTKSYHAYGAAATLFRSLDAEILIEGPAGTGKTRAILEKVYACAREYPGMRCLLIRKTKSSMPQSILETWDRFVLQLNDGVEFSHKRQSYVFTNGSEVLLGSLDDSKAIVKIMSMELDMIASFETTEITENDWETLQTRLRNQSTMPFKQSVADCNPSYPQHWLNQRCNRGHMTRLHSKHDDNPSVDPKYLRTLQNLTGVRRARLYEGRWAAAEGMVYDQWDPTVHIISQEEMGKIVIRRTIGSCDWGFRAPGVLQAWGLDADRNMYLMAEHYHTGKPIEWWVDRALEFKEIYHADTWVPDPEDPEKVDKFRRAGLNCVIPDKRIEMGLDLVRQRLKPLDGGKPSLYIVDGALALRDETLVQASQAFCTVQEIDNYVYPKAQDGKLLKEKPEDHDDHGCDSMRYAVWQVDKGVSIDPKTVPRKPYALGTLGHLTDHHLAFDPEPEKNDPFA